jgi:photosystem II stability/assembly factor-like uncharacterized protein
MRFRSILMLAFGVIAAMHWLPAQQGESASGGSDPMFRGMRYRNIGPFRGGRSLAVTGVAGDPNTYYFGAAGGGVWKTTDGALTWSPIFDRESAFSIGAIAVAPSDPNVIYVGTGETALRGDIAQGDGVYKSMDAGKTWTNVGLRDTRAIGRILIHPRNPDIALVAALGHPFGHNAERGVFRTTDGGKTWEKVLYKDEYTGAVDLAFDPVNPNIVFACLWQAQRSPWGFESGGPGSGIYRSADGGATWKQVKGGGLPAGPWGKSGIAVAANSERVYALIQAKDGGLYRSDDGGSRWTLTNPSRSLVQRAFYYMHIFADPKSPDTLYILNVEFNKSTDGGRTFTRIRPPHGDNHALWIDPTNTNRMISGDDGGATVTIDGGRHWSPQTNQPTAQFYHVITDNRFPYYVYGAQQDNTTVAIASRSDSGSIDRPDWYPVGGGESGYIAPYPPDPLIVYAGGYEGSLTRYDRHTGQTKQISPWPEITDGEGAAHLTHRFQWTSPTVISPHDPNVLYHGGEQLFKTTDAGMHWEAISPDLTRNDKSKQIAAGGKIDLDDTGTEYYDTIFSIAESPKAKGEIWVGTDDGLVQLTRDGGKTWSNVTPKDLPEWSRVSLVEASPHDPAAAYIAANHYQMDDLAPYFYKTTDYGKTWTKITTGIPNGAFARAIREDPKRHGLLYAGTELGTFVSFDDGGKWQSLRLNMPVTPVHDLAVKDDDLVLATHGRAFWILDDLSPLRQYDDDVAKADVHVYAPATALRFHGGGRGGGGGRGAAAAGENPPAGAIIYYYLKSAPQGEVSIEILDEAGKPVRKYSSLKTQRVSQVQEIDAPPPHKEIEPTAGLNRFVWDLHYEPTPQVPNYSLFEYARGETGPLALPGKYQVKLTVAGKTYTQPLELRLDPRVKVSREDLKKQFTLLERIHKDLANIYMTVNQMQDVRLQLKQLPGRLSDGQPGAAQITRTCQALDEKIEAAEDVLVNFKITASEDSLAYPLGLDGKLAFLASTVQGNSDSAPTEPQYQLFAQLSKKLDEGLSRWGHILSVDLADFQKLTSQYKLQTIVVKGEATK